MSARSGFVIKRGLNKSVKYAIGWGLNDTRSKYL